MCAPSRTFVVNRGKQNEAGSKIADFPAYFDELLRRMGYVNAAHMCRVRFHIHVTIKPDGLPAMVANSEQ